MTENGAALFQRFVFKLRLGSSLFLDEGILYLNDKKVTSHPMVLYLLTCQLYDLILYVYDLYKGFYLQIENYCRTCDCSSHVVWSMKNGCEVNRIHTSSGYIAE